MNKLAHFCMLSAFAVGGCLHTVEGPQPLKAEGRVDLINRTAPNINDWPVVLPGNDDRKLDEDVIRMCKGPPEDQAKIAVLPAILPIVAGWVIDYAISTASSWAKQRLAEYSGLTAGAVRFGPPSAQSYFYKSAPPPELAVQCMRLRRIIKETAKDGTVISETLAAEAIVLIELTPPKDALLITPLRLYFDKPLALTSKSSTAEFGVSLGATFDAIWQAEQTGEGKAVRVWSETVAAQKILRVNDTDGTSTTKRTRFYYYNLNENNSTANPPVAVPLVPWSRQDRTTPTETEKKSLGAGKLTLVLAEVGDPPLILELVAGTLNDHGKDIGDFLKDAAKKAIEKE